MISANVAFNAYKYILSDNSNLRKYWADEINEAKYNVSISHDNGETWKTLGLFCGINRTFDDSMYYLNYWDSNNKFTHTTVYYRDSYWSQFYPSTLIKLTLNGEELSND